MTLSVADSMLCTIRPKRLLYQNAASDLCSIWLAGAEASDLQGTIFDSCRLNLLMIHMCWRVFPRYQRNVVKWLVLVFQTKSASILWDYRNSCSDSVTRTSCLEVWKSSSWFCGNRFSQWGAEPMVSKRVYQSADVVFSLGISKYQEMVLL